MGEVYQARDTTLDRDVALKVLPDAFTADPDRLARFQREAKVLASLNHPNIGAIYGLEAAGDTQALVLELIEGPTLAERIAEGPVPVEQVVAMVRQMAEALSAAHDAGVIHRDLKPANIKVRPDGTVKVLDFGLAKAVEGAGGDATESPTMTAMSSQAGAIIGTAAYMAPEQARGEAVDKRADSWALGCVCYELLSGRRAFEGRTLSDTLASVLAREADFAQLPADVPAAVRKFINRCLEKEPTRRLRDAAEGMLQLEEGLAQSEISEASGKQDAKSSAAWQRPQMVAAIAAVSAIAAGVAVWSLMGDVPDIQLPVTRAVIPLGSDESFGFSGRRVLGLSPNGRYLAYQANFQLYLRAMDQMVASPIRGTETFGGSSGRSTAFSPDNQWIAFFHDGQIKKVAVTGGAPIALCDAVDPWGLSWSEDDNILFGQGPAGVSMVLATGGVAEVVVAIDEGERAQSPQLLPGGEWLLFTLRSNVAATWSESQIVVQSLATGERRVLVDGGTDGRYVPTGHIVYAQDGTLLAVRFDASTNEVTPGPVPLVEDVAMAGFTGGAHYDVADSGMLAYVPASSFGTEIFRVDRTLALVDRSGGSERLDLPPNQYVSPRLSPDGRRVAVQTDGDRSVIWTYDLSGAAAIQRLTVDGNSFRPLWSPDGERIAFYRLPTRDIFLMSPDGSEVDSLSQVSGIRGIPSWSPDGDSIAVLSGTNIYIMDDEGGGVRLIPTAPAGGRPTWSPDSRWIAFQVRLTRGPIEVLNLRLPETRSLVVQDGWEPDWASD